MERAYQGRKDPKELFSPSGCSPSKDAPIPQPRVPHWELPFSKQQKGRLSKSIRNLAEMGKI